MSGYDTTIKFHVYWLSGSETGDVPARAAWQVPKAIQAIYDRF